MGPVGGWHCPFANIVVVRFRDIDGFKSGTFKDISMRSRVLLASKL